MPNTQEEQNIGQPSQGMRTFVSFLLFVHLFTVVMTINSEFRPASPLRAGLGRIGFLEPYMQLLHMDIAYNYHLTYGPMNPLDFDHRVEFYRNYSAASDEAESQVPDESDTLTQTNRYRNLARSMVEFVEQPGLESIFPASVAKRLILDGETHDGNHRLRIVRYVPLSREEARSLDADPNAADQFETVYEADVILSYNKLLKRHEVILNKVEAAGETAPVERRN